MPHHALLRDFVSHQASTESSCCANVDLYLFSLFSYGNLHQNLAPAPFVVFRSAASPRSNPLLTSCRSVSWTRFCKRTLGYVQKNIALDFLVPHPMCVSLRFLWGVHRAPRPLRVHGSHHRLRLTALEMNSMMRGLPEVMRAFCRITLSSL